MPIWRSRRRSSSGAAPAERPAAPAASPQPAAGRSPAQPARFAAAATPDSAAAEPAEPSAAPSSEGPPTILLTATSPEQRAVDHLAVVVPALRAAGIDFWHVPRANPPGRTRLATQATPDQVLAAVRAALDEFWTVALWNPQTRTWDRVETELQATPLPPAPAALQFYTTVKDPGGQRRIAMLAAVEVESWAVAGANLVAPRSHPRGNLIPADDPRTDPLPVRGQMLSGRAALQVSDPEHFGEPIDAVYAWVDSADPVYAAARAPWLARPASTDPYSQGQARTRSLDELRYSLRSLDMFAPWIRRVYLVTDMQRPEWLAPSVTVVDHREILADHGQLPTFNSHAIESALHRIPGLSEHYLYFNDDVMLGNRVSPSDFFTGMGLLKFQPSGEFLPAGAVTPDEAAPGVAGRRVRDLLERDFGRTITHKLRHTPHPQRRSLAGECADRYGAEWAATAGHQWRDAEDIAPIQLTLWYALFTGRAITNAAEYRYVELAEISDVATLNGLSRKLRSTDMFCLNMRSEPLLPWEELAPAITELMAGMFPFTSRFEVEVGAG